MNPQFPRPVRAPGPGVPAKQTAAERLHAYRRRAWSIRKRVIATALVAFALLWAVLFVQLATGHDPALSKKSTSSSSVTGTSSGAVSSGSTTSSGSGSTTGSGSGTTPSSGSSTSGATSPVTTGQS